MIKKHDFFIHPTLCLKITNDLPIQQSTKDILSQSTAVEQKIVHTSLKKTNKTQKHKSTEMSVITSLLKLTELQKTELQ